jgi:site-specific DNA-cytosine methylase
MITNDKTNLASAIPHISFGSVCSGIEAASVAFSPLGWRAAWLAEIEPFPSAVLAHHYPDVPNLGDMTALPERILCHAAEAPDIFCGGTPCQAFSVAGLRKSLDDARGNLSLTFCEIANAIDAVRADDGKQPAIVFWENVPGVLSTKDNAFGCFLAGLAGEDDPLVAPGGKWTNSGCVLGPQRAVAWRTLDAQYFGLAQRRRRVFVVASARSGFDPAAVLFEFDGVRRDTAPRREARQIAPTIPSRSTAGDGLGTDFDLDGGNAVAVALRGREGGATAELGDEVGNCLRASSGGGDKPHVLTAAQVRRLTPVECERLQGLPDDYTAIPWRKKTADQCPDGPRYKALGNSWAVPVVAWIGQRINRAMQELT